MQLLQNSEFKLKILVQLFHASQGQENCVVRLKSYSFYEVNTTVLPNPEYLTTVDKPLFPVSNSQTHSCLVF